MISATYKFVFALSSKSITPTQQEVIDLLTQTEVNWEQICEISIKQGVGTLVYNSLQALKGKIIFDENKILKLNHLFYANSTRNIFLLHELKKQIKKISDETTEFALIKGFALQSDLYGIIALRQMGDFDFFTPHKNAQKLFDLFKLNGFTQSDEFISCWHQQHFSEIGKHLPDLTNGVYKIDILPELILKNNLFNTDAWANLISMSIDGLEVKTLSPDFNLHFLCYHLDQHFAEDGIHLGLYCDIAEHIKKYADKIDWKNFILDIDKYGISKNQYRHILIVEQFLFASLHPILKNFIASFDQEKIIREFFEALEKPLNTDNTKNQEYKLYKVKQIKGFKNKFFYLSGELFPKKEFMLQRYNIKNKKLVYLHYPVRIASSIKKTFRILLKKKNENLLLVFVFLCLQMIHGSVQSVFAQQLFVCTLLCYTSFI